MPGREGSFHYIIRCSVELTGSLEGVPVPRVVFYRKDSSGLLRASHTFLVWQAAGGTGPC